MIHIQSDTVYTTVGSSGSTRGSTHRGGGPWGESPPGLLRDRHRQTHHPVGARHEAQLAASAAFNALTAAAGWTELPTTVVNDVIP